MLPAAMAVNSVSVNSYDVVASDDDDDDDDDFDFDDDRDDDKDSHAIGISRPIVVCRNVSQNSADLILKLRVRNRTHRTITGIVSYEVEDKNGKEVAIVNDKITIPAGKTVVSKSSVRINRPHLFSVEKGYRYKVEAEVLDNRGEEISNERSSKFVIKNGASSVRKLPRNTARQKHPGNNLVKRNKMVKLEKALK